MISFRYHLVSIIAVLLALAIGIVLGSGFLGGVLLEQVQANAERIARANEDLRAQNAEQERTLNLYRDFAEEAEVELVGGALATRQVAVFTLDGTDEAAVDGVIQAIESAGGSVTSVVRGTGKLSLDSPEDRAELAFILGTPGRSANELRRELGVALGTAASAVASPDPAARRQGTAPSDNLEDLLRRLTESEFMVVEPGVGARAIPPLGLFLVAVGGTADPPTRPLTYVRALAVSLQQHDRAVLVAEPSASTWAVVERLLSAARSFDRVSTVDHAETIPGRIAVVLGLRRAALGRVGHYGNGSGAVDGVMPTPAPLAG